MSELAARRPPAQRLHPCDECRLRSVCIPDHLDEPLAAAVASIIRPLPPMPRGTYLFREGAPMTSFFFVRSGSAKSVVNGGDGNESVMSFLYPSDIVGTASMDQGAYRDSVVTLERSSFCEVRSKELAVLFRGDASVQHTFLAKISNRILTERHARMRLEHSSADQRVADFLLELSARMRAIGRDDDTLFLSMSRYDIANYVSLAAETVSRVLSRLRSGRLIEVRHKHVHLLDRDGLARIAGVARRERAQRAHGG